MYWAEQARSGVSAAQYYRAHNSLVHDGSANPQQWKVGKNFEKLITISTLWHCYYHSRRQVPFYILAHCWNNWVLSVWVTVLTVCDLKLGLGHDAACYSESLTDVVAGVRALHRWNGQFSIHGHWNAAVSLRWLVGEQKVLQRARAGSNVKTM